METGEREERREKKEERREKKNNMDWGLEKGKAREKIIYGDIKVER